MKPNAIILDFDGPMFPNKVFIDPNNQGEYAKKMCENLDLHPQVKYWKMDSFSVIAINQLLAAHPDNRLVISSSWANPHFHTKTHINSLLKANGVEFQFHDDWATLKNGANRTENIARWLQDNPVNEYFIFDDIESAPEMVSEELVKSFGLDPQRIALVSLNDGISYKDFYQAKKYLIE